MINLETPTDAGAAILDESSVSITDADGSAILDENVVMENVWGREELIAGVFVELDFSTPLYLSTLDVDLYHNDQKYTASEIKVTSLRLGSDLSVDTCALEVGNVNLTLSSLLNNTDQLESTVTVRIGGVSPTTFMIYDLHPIFIGHLTGWPTLTEKTVDLTCSGLMSGWAKKTLRIAQTSCPWPQGGDDCGYTGSGVCGQAFSNCNSFGNHLNYGGFVYLSDLMEKKLYWGHYPP